MTTKRNRVYARITDYGDLLIPASLLEQIIDQGYVACAGYVNDQEAITELRKIKRVSMHTCDEVQSCLAQMALEGKS